MSGNTGSSSTMPLKDRLSLRLVVLSVVAFLAVFLGSLVYDVFRTMQENRSLESNLVAQPEVVSVDPKIETNLTKVLAFDEIPSAVEVSDPFNDTSGISNLINLPAGAKLTQQSSGGTGSKGNTGTNQAATNSSASKTQAVKTSGQSNPASKANAKSAKASSTEATISRIMKREERIRVGQYGGPESIVFAIEDLLPVGVVSGGLGKEEVMFYSQAAGRTVSFPVGTRFFDGWLADIKPEGVIFRFDDKAGSVRMKAWGRTINSANTRSLSMMVPQNRLVTTGEK